jgi:hypothetical protein
MSDLFQFRYIAKRLRSFRIRCTASGILGLLVVLAIGVVEPVLCIMHCTLWVPLSRSAQMAHHHHHRMPDGTLMMSAMPESTAASAGQDGHLAVSLCMSALSPWHSPLLPSAQAFHEFTLALALLIIIALLASYAAAPPPSRILHGHSPPTLRPPIPQAS